MPPKAAPRRQPARRNTRTNAAATAETNADTDLTITGNEISSQPAPESSVSASNAKGSDIATPTGPPPPTHAPVQRLQSLNRRPASTTFPAPGTAPGTKAPLRFQPKTVARKSKEERDRVARLEAERAQAKLAAAGVGNQESARGGAGGRGALRGGKGRGAFTGSGRGGWLGRGDRHDQGAVSGPFGAGFYAREVAGRKVGRGSRGVDGVKGEAGVKLEGGVIGGVGFTGGGGVRVKSEDQGDMYISSEDEEHKNEGPRMNIEQINLVSDEGSDEEVSVTNKGKGRAKEARSLGFVLKPIRIDRKEHIERAGGVNTEASAMTSAEMRKRAKERGGPGDSLFLPMDEGEAGVEKAKKKGKGKVKDVEFLRDERKWKGVYEDEKDKVDEPRVKDEPLDDDDHPAVHLPAATIGPGTDPKSSERASSSPPAAASDNIDPSIKPKPTPKLKEKRTLKVRDTKPVLQTEEDRQEWSRHQEDIRLLDHELRLMDTGSTSLSLPKSDADGNALTTEDDDATPKVTEQKEGRVYLIQLPPIVPALVDTDPDVNAEAVTKPANIKPDPEPTPAHKTSSSSAPAPPPTTKKSQTIIDHPVPTPNPQHGTFAPGHLGTLKLKQSGRVLLSWGSGSGGASASASASLELARGAETEFLQDVVVADARKGFGGVGGEVDMGGGDGEGRGKNGWGLGQVMGGFVVRPDWGRVFGGC